MIAEQKQPLWQEAVAMVCTQCFQRLPQALQTPKLLELRSWLKQRLQLEWYWDRLRVLTTGCQGFCPNDQFCIYLQNRQQKEKEIVWILDPEVDREGLYQELIAFCLSKKP